MNGRLVAVLALVLALLAPTPAEAARTEPVCVVSRGSDGGGDFTLVEERQIADRARFLLENPTAFVRPGGDCGITKAYDAPGALILLRDEVAPGWCWATYASHQLVFTDTGAPMHVLCVAPPIGE